MSRPSELVQVSELFRRGVVRPLDEAALLQLREGFVSKAIRCECLMIGSEDLFARFWDHGVLSAINTACGTLIDEYEETFIEVDDLTKAVAAVTGAIATTHEPEVHAFAVSLFELLE